MFPQTITVYRHKVKNGADFYEKQTVSGFYCYGKSGLSIQGRGVQNADAVEMISSPEAARTFASQWTCGKGDRVLIGEGNDISSFKDIPNAYTVLSVQTNIIGSPCDSVTISVV